MSRDQNLCSDVRTVTPKELISIGRIETTFPTPDQDMLGTGMQFGYYL
jgi:hypothetical protein